MKQPISGRSISLMRLGVAAALFFAIIAVTGFSCADKTGMCTSASSVKATNVDPLDARIEALHEKLKITPSQEELWNDVAQAMRSNARTMSDLLAELRSRKGKTTNPVDDMKSYGKIAQAHADGVKRFIPPFEALYNSLSDDQKKTIEEADLKF